MQKLMSVMRRLPQELMSVMRRLRVPLFSGFPHGLAWPKAIGHGISIRLMVTHILGSSVEWGNPP